MGRMAFIRPVLFLYFLVRIGKGTTAVDLVRGVEERLDEASVRKFVDCLMQDLSRGVHFPHEVALSALAVALESEQSELADEFLHKLSRISIPEMPMSPGVARECLRHRMGRVVTSRSLRR